MGYPAFEHVLHPRMGAFKTILETADQDNCSGKRKPAYKPLTVVLRAAITLSQTRK